MAVADHGRFLTHELLRSLRNIMINLLQGSQFEVKSGSLSVSVATYTICAAICIGLLVLRRFVKPFGRAELGGPVALKWITGISMVSLWFIYVLISSLTSYKKIFA